MKGLKLECVHKNFGKSEIIKNVDLEISPGEFCVFVGPSGCGKSTLLRMISGLEDTSMGSILIGQRNVTNLDPAQRGVAMVFQTYALYPHMNVEENMGFGLKMNKIDKKEVEKKVQHAIEILRLEPFRKNTPRELSGGQRQRVAIGRAIVRNPDVFLFDEPLSNLDAELRVEMRAEIARLHRKLKSTMVYVTHDQVEAMTLADKIVVLRAGIIEQVGSPLELYENPSNRFVAGFIGSPAMNFMLANIDEDGIYCQEVNIRIERKLDFKNEVLLGIRPEHLTIDKTKSDLTVDFIENLGGNQFIYVKTSSGQKVTVQANDDTRCKMGDSVGLKFKKEKYYLFDKQKETKIRI